MQEKSRGTDIYLNAGVSLPDAVIAATGRRYSHRDIPGMHPDPEAGPLLREIGCEGFQTLGLFIRTNAVLSCAVLKTDYCIGIHAADAFELIPLILLTIHERGRGEYLVDLSPLDYMLNETLADSPMQNA